MIIGIDLGTSMVKAAAFSEEGENLAVATRKARLHYLDSERIEQDLEEIVAAVGEIVGEVARKSGEAPRAVGITGQGDGLWLLDEQGRAVRPPISWLDARGNSILEEWMDSGVYEAIFRRNGNTMFPGCQAPLMAAVDREEPESLERATTASYLKDAILQRLTGVRVTEASDASLPFLDVVHRSYDPEILRLCGLEEHERLLAPVAPPPGEAYPLNSTGAALTGLPEGLRVHAGPFDLPACAMGAGVNQTGDGLITIGTTLACQVLTDQVDTAGEPAGMTLCMPYAGRWMRAMAAMVGTASLDWALSLTGAEHTDLEDLLAQSEPGARGVTALPYFSASGERAPFCDPAARGQLSGLSLGASRADVVTAVCESVAYATRHCVEAVGMVGEVSVCGGGVESRAWCQIIADVLQVPLRIAPRPEVGARGAAIAALVALGSDFDYHAWTRPDGYIEPRAEVADRYEEGFAYYLQSVKSARELWHVAPGVSAAQ